jgi:hypothetical protein
MIVDATGERIAGMAQQTCCPRPEVVRTLRRYTETMPDKGGPCAAYLHEIRGCLAENIPACLVSL